MMYPLVRELAVDGIPVTVTCRVLEIARAPYYRWLADPVTDAEWVAAHRANALFDAHRDDPDLLGSGTCSKDDVVFSEVAVGVSPRGGLRHRTGGSDGDLLVVARGCRWANRIVRAPSPAGSPWPVAATTASAQGRVRSRGVSSR